MTPLRILDDLRRRVLVHRRLLGAAFAAVAAWTMVQAATAPPPPTERVWTASHDLTGGTVLTRDDLRPTGFAPGTAPVAAVEDPAAAIGRTLATPLGAGEPLTLGHLAGADALAGYPGRAAVAVRIPDPDVVSLLTPGQHVALVASDPQGGGAPERVVEDAAVLAVPRGTTGTGGGAALTGRLVVFAVPESDADSLASAATSRYLSVVWSR